ncbi:MAG: ketoacyl-ACP synthase III family protein [Gaiellaceae bacterium]
MKWNDIFLAGTGVWLPERTSMVDAVKAGLTTPDHRTATGQVAACVAGTDDIPVDMAISAGRTALRRSGVDPSDVSLLLHAVCHFQGIDEWTPSSYIQAHTIGASAQAIEVRQWSNGGMAALEMAAAHVTCRTGGASALVTTGENFGWPAWYRWHSPRAGVLGDGGTALVISRRPGWGRLLATASYGDPSLEGIARGDDGFRLSPDGVPDFDRRKRAYVEKVGLRCIGDRIRKGMRIVVEEVLRDAGIELSQVTHIVAPHVGRATLKGEVLRPIGADIDRTTWEWGRTVGHLGGGDQAAGLNHLVESGQLANGDYVLVLGNGLGSNWTCAVIQVVAGMDR